MREVLLDGQRIDVDPEDYMEITYENAMLQSVSDLGGSYTNTFTIPLTAHNRAVIGGIDDIDVVSEFMYDWRVYEEYRDGIPVIQNGRAKILEINPRENTMSLYVIWGAVKTLANAIGKGNINELRTSGVAYRLWWGEGVEFLKPTDTYSVGFLHYISIANLPVSDSKQENIQYSLPSIRTDYIIESIFENIDIPIEISSSVAEKLSKLWIPTLTRNKEGDTTVPTSGIMKASTASGFAETRGYAHSYLTPIQDDGVGSFRRAIDSRFLLYLNDNASYRVNAVMSMKVNDGNIGDGIVFSIRIWEWKNDHTWLIAERYISLTDSSTGGNFDNSTKMFTYSDTFDAFEIADLADPQPRLMDVIYLQSGTSYTQLRNGQNATINNTYTFWRNVEIPMTFNSYVYPMLNLPKISQMDFLKNILYMTGSYAYFDNDGASIKIDSVDSVLDSEPLNIERWITTLRPETIEYTYSDYARSNTYNYLADDTVNTQANGAIILSNNTLEEEKEIITLKFAPTDDILETAQIFTFDNHQLEDGLPGFVGNSLKPRIITIRDNTDKNRIEGTFSAEMMWTRILDNDYKMLTDVLADIRAIEVEMYLQPADIYLLNVHNKFYFWGSYWIAKSITVSTDGGATGEFLKLK